MSGRGLRIADGKHDCWFFDFCGNIKRLGLPTNSFNLVLCPNQKGQKIIPTKTCPECISEIAIYEKYCPHCGFVFPHKPKKAKSSSVKRKFEEILSPTQKKEIRFIKNRAIDAFDNYSLFHIETEFYRKFKYFMPEEWYEGLIFASDDDTWEACLQHYWRYLLDVYKQADPIGQYVDIEKCIRREFKSTIDSSINVFKSALMSTQTELHEVYQAIADKTKQLIRYQTWWEILGREKPIPADSIIEVYIQRKGLYASRYYNKPDAFLAHTELLDLAVTEAIQYHKTSQITIAEHVYTVKGGIKHAKFDFVCQYVKELVDTTRERVWSELTNYEKQEYRSWQKRTNNGTISDREYYANLNKKTITIPEETEKLIPKQEEVTIPEEIRRIMEAKTTEQVKKTITEHAPVQISIPNNTANVQSQKPAYSTVASENKQVASSIGQGVQLTLFPETDTEKALKDVINPLRLEVGNIVTNSNHTSKVYNLKGKITKVHASDKRLCQVFYPSNGNYAWCRYVDLRRCN